MNEKTLVKVPEKKNTIASRQEAQRARLAARYLRDLRAYLRRGGRQSGSVARELGRAMLAKGFVTLDLAVMHERAVVLLATSYDFARTSNGALRRAGTFFTQALVPLEAAQRATRLALAHLHDRNATLRRHTAELELGNRRLQREVVRREKGEAIIRRGREQYRTLLGESQVMQRKLRRLTHQVIAVQENERKEISRELHDEVVQSLVGINVELEALAQWTTVGMQTLKTKIMRTQRLVQNSVKSVHRFARELRPSVLDDLGLIPALHAFNQSLAARKKLKIKMTVFSGVEALSEEKRIVLFRVAQEALTNVGRHASASEVTVTIVGLRDAVRMEITDNGRSFEVKRTLVADTNKRLGLIGMRERLEMVGGVLTIESAPGKGTTVRAQIPIPCDKSKL